jgi:hypothetical protein
MRRIPPTPENVRTALSHVPASCERKTWVGVLAAIKDALGEAGRDIADQWSQGGDDYCPADFRDAWKSVKPGGKVTVATLWRMALNAGWKPGDEAREETEAERLERERRRKALAAKEAKDQAKREKIAAAKASDWWRASRALRQPLPAKKAHLSGWNAQGIHGGTGGGSPGLRAQVGRQAAGRAAVAGARQGRWATVHARNDRRSGPEIGHRGRAEVRRFLGRSEPP